MKLPRAAALTAAAVATVALLTGCGSDGKAPTPKASSSTTGDPSDHEKVPSTQAAKTWARKWCQVHNGMPLERAQHIMGASHELTKTAYSFGDDDFYFGVALDGKTVVSNWVGLPKGLPAQAQRLFDCDHS